MKHPPLSLLRPRRKRAWLNLDSVAKASAIATPILIAAGGWYVSTAAQTREQTVQTFKETAQAIGTLSVSDDRKQRDVLFSIIQLNNPELLRRTASYVDARIEYEEIRAEEGTRNDVGATAERFMRTAETRANYRRIRQEIFEPLIVGAFQAGDEALALNLIGAVPSSVRFSRLVSSDRETFRRPGRQNEEATTTLVQLSLLDFAVSARAERAVMELLRLGVQPHFWTVNRAVAADNDAIFRAVIGRASRSYSVAWEIWSYVARYGRTQHVNALAASGFAEDTDTPIAETPILVQAALARRHDLIPDLVRAGFTPIRASIDANEEIMAFVAREEASNQSRTLSAPTQTENQRFGDTIKAICTEYLRASIQFDDVRSQLSITERDRGRASAGRNPVLRQVFQSGEFGSIDCLGQFYRLAELSDGEKWALIREAGTRRGRAVQLLHERFGFSLELAGPNGMAIAHLASERGDHELLTYLGQRGANLKRTDSRGRSIWHHLVLSDFNRIPAERDVLFPLQARNFRRLVAVISQKVPLSLPNDDGWTALHLSVRARLAAETAILLDFGAPLDALTQDGQSVLSIAAGTPRLFINLYQRGARAAGRIESCDEARALLAWLDEQGEVHRPVGAVGDAWAPEKAVAAATPHCGS